MERPQCVIAPAEDCYDHELSQVQTDFLALTDALLEHRDPDHRLTCVDMVVEGDPERVYADVTATRVGSVLTGDDEQLAVYSTGERYPVLDLRKANATLTGVSIRVWGWDYEKVRYTDVDLPKPSYPRPYKVYEGQSDTARQLDISFQYDVGGHCFSDSVCVYASSTAPDNTSVRNNVWIADYAEMGYEGNGHHSIDDLTDAELYEFMDVVARLVGDTPISFSEQGELRAQELIDSIADSQYTDIVFRIVEATRPVQAVYELTQRRYDELDGATLVEALSGDDAARRTDAATIAESCAREYETWQEKSQVSADSDGLLD